MPYQPLTPEQYKSARQKFSNEQIIQMEQRRKSDSQPPAPAETFERKSQGGFLGGLGKVRDFAVDVVGGGKLAEGLGMAIAAPGVQKSLSGVEQQASDIELQLIKTINKNKAVGKDNSRLNRALSDLQKSKATTRQTQENFISALPSNREVIGSAIRLGASAVLPSVAKGLTPGVLPGVTGVASRLGADKAVGAIPGLIAGAKTGLVTGAIEGGVQGAGLGIEQEKDTMGVATSALTGSLLGSAVGGIGGGIFGAYAGKSKATQNKMNQIGEILKTNPDSRTAGYILKGADTIEDPIAKEAIKQGVSQPGISTMKNASAADKAKGIKMLDTLVKGRTDPKFGALNRPSDVVGDSVTERFTRVLDINKEAKGKLDTVAKALQGQKVDPENAIVHLKDDLEAMRITFKNGNPVFNGSDIDELPGPQQALNRLFKRMNNISADDPYEMHRLKQYIDEVVDYGDNGTGISGKTETVLKRFRHNIDKVLDDSFPDYNKVNTSYSSTRKAIDEFSDAMGTKFDFNAPNPEKLIGSRARAILSNQQSRVQVLNALQKLQDIAETGGKKFDDDLVTQVLLVDEFEKLLPPINSTSLAGEVGKGFNKTASIATRLRQGSGGPIEMAIRGAGKVAESAQNINEEQLIKTIRNLLSR